jgi:hypothetical protein
MFLKGVMSFFSKRPYPKKITSFSNDIVNRMNENKRLPPNEWETPLAEPHTKTKRLVKCGRCGGFGHNRRGCNVDIEGGRFCVLDSVVV